MIYFLESYFKSSFQEMMNHYETQLTIATPFHTHPSTVLRTVC